MSKVFYIYEDKPVRYTYKVYANSKSEALAKFNSHADYEEIGLDPGVGTTKITIEECGRAVGSCANCGSEWSPENVGDYLCGKCGKG